MTVGTTVSLAFHNLRRHPRRTIITASALAFGLTAYIAMDSLVRGLEEESRQNIILYETGSAQVLAEGYLEDRDLRPLTYVIEDAEVVLSKLSEAHLRATPRTVFTGELIVLEDPFEEDGSAQVVCYGIDPERDREVFRLLDDVSEGHMPRAGEEGVMIGSWLAEDIGARVGYPITIVTRTRSGYYQTLDFEITGVLTSPNPILDARGLFIPIDVVDLYLQMDGAVTEISVAGRISGTDSKLQSRISSALTGTKGIEVVGWETLASDFIELIQYEWLGTGVLLFFVFIIAAVGVSNTVLMSTLERKKEIGMMQALGFHRYEISRLFLTEAAGLALVGGVLGALVAIPLNFLIVRYGIDYSFWFRENLTGYRVAGIIRGVWFPATYPTAILVGAIITLITAALPVRRILKTTIIENLR